MNTTSFGFAPGFGFGAPAFGFSQTPAWNGFGFQSPFAQTAWNKPFGATPWTPASFSSPISGQPFGFGAFSPVASTPFCSPMGLTPWGSSPFGGFPQSSFSPFGSTPSFASGFGGFGSTFGSSSTPWFGASSTPWFGASSTPWFGASFPGAFSPISNPWGWTLPSTSWSAPFNSTFGAPAFSPAASYAPFTSPVSSFGQPTSSVYATPKAGYTPNGQYIPNSFSSQFSPIGSSSPAYFSQIPHGFVPQYPGFVPQYQGFVPPFAQPFGYSPFGATTPFASWHATPYTPSYGFSVPANYPYPTQTDGETSPIGVSQRDAA